MGDSPAKEMTAQELVTHKAAMALEVVDPETVTHAVQGIYTGCIAVIAVLKIKFAKTVALGEAIGDKTYLSLKNIVEPNLVAMVPEKYQKWVPVALRWSC